MSQEYTAPFEAGYYYHVYNRAIGNELLFYQEENYLYFLKKYSDIISEHVETYVYTLIPNHFHFLIRIPDELENPEKTVSERFRRFGISYSQSINKQQGRRGSLFMRPFKRKRVNSNEQLTTLIYYIHYNAVHHGIVKDLANYQWSSYLSIVSNKKTQLEREKVLDWFGAMEQFISSHAFQREVYSGIKDLVIE